MKKQFLILTLAIFSASAFAYSCGDKKYCKQMTSCSEAVYYLKQCGMTRLDRDKDGIPCEKICGKNGQNMPKAKSSKKKGKKADKKK
ncbi:MULTISPECIES: excalibur calcium-binding domain-containing protein [Pasteurellaceae]|uniref:Excalibur calcium-binding domain-containing protein n=1 Tax=Pasteurella atlantica TaxID=2827233 RepID=A0AAW8CNL1_9PAST|nr:excalibur calcium-binding domain-containing protein [Pasteurella atlantica]MBR0573366.1 excalibur calcium-binding domain-containing protein [Pasteurella atlantica]MDP8039826.1 excalibur calcium-binding domain-containing protein [Pasteurella atlantica]MDP8041843.1 excalibur calcium-binding domain-containing protein [Pasteurella atlantica]MDP8043910.1 excalibur calcium-binding domain-containing protein [Pasteurella atlantica]MDP8046087.1 excalibur calcium-binding domain-containing protein [Pa